MPTYAKMIIRGAAASNAEVWSIGLSFGPETATFAVANYQTWADETANNLETIAIPDLLALLSTSGSIVSVRAEGHNADGTLAVAAESALTAPRLGTGGIDKPPQCALVISLLTGIVGSSFRGRVYWPCFARTLLANGTIAPTALDEYLTDMNTLNSDILANASLAGITTGSPELVVRSNLRDTNTPVTLFRAGSVIDTQRRRRDDLAEIYVDQAVTTPP